jgi:hypothetical protein
MEFQNVLHIDITVMLSFLYTFKCIVKSFNNDKFEGLTLENMISHTCMHSCMVQYMLMDIVQYILIDLIYRCGETQIDRLNLWVWHNTYRSM